MSNVNLTRRAIEDRAHRIEQYYNRHDKDKKKVYAHFMDEGISKKTIYHVLRRIEQSGEVTFKKPTGRKVSVCTPEMFEKVAELFKNNPSLSCREGAKILQVPRTSIFRIMAKMRELNIETYKVIDNIPRCPTCKQKIDEKIVENLKKRKQIKTETIEEDNEMGEEEEESIDYNEEYSSETMKQEPHNVATDIRNQSVIYTL